MSFTPHHRGGAGEPLVLVHGFTDTWRTWELVLPALEREHDVLAPTLLGHAGGPPVPDRDDLAAATLDAVERAMDAAGLTTAHIAGNSLGGWVALALAARGRARSVVALAPAGGWADDAYQATLDHFTRLHGQLQMAAPYADQAVRTPEGRRRATLDITVSYEHLPAELLSHQLRGAAACAVEPLVASARREGWPLDPAQVACPVRFVWGTEDRLLPWPSAAHRYAHDWFPHADRVELDGVGHCPQLDVPLETAELIRGFTR